jgi:hypothetical protein
MNKDQFIDLVARYAQEKNMSEEKMMALVENLFEELEITHRRRQASQMYEAYEMKKRSEQPESGDMFDHFRNESFGTHSNERLIKEMRRLRKAIEQLSRTMNPKPENE